MSLSHLKPAAKTKTLLLLSAALWSGIGFMLLSKGLYRLGAVPDYKMVVFLTGAAAGFIKARLMIDRAARRGVERIENLEDGTCLGAVYSLKTWLLVLCMMGMGGILRNSGLPMALLSFIYLTIGVALLTASRHAWAAWRRR